MDHDLSLLVLRFDRHEAHARAASGFADRLGVVGIVLTGPPLPPVRGDESRIDDLGLVPHRAQRPRPVMGTRSGFHRHHRRPLLRKEDQQLTANHRLANHHALGGIHPADRETALCQIQTKADNR
jgi:hypothetical protein